MWDNECLDDCADAIHEAIDNLSKVVSNKAYGCSDLDDYYKDRLEFALKHLRIAQEAINN